LEWNDHLLTGRQSRDRIAEVDDLADHLVSHRERRGNRVEPEGDDGVKIATCNGHRANQGVTSITQLRLWTFLPGQLAWPAEYQVSHGDNLLTERCRNTLLN